VSGEDEISEAASTAQRVGDKLRAAREAQGLSIEEIAGSTRIPKRHLTTIENGSYDGLPAPTYSAGFIRTGSCRSTGLSWRPRRPSGPSCFRSPANPGTTSCNA